MRSPLDILIKSTEDSVKVLELARRDANSATGFFLQRQVKQWIRSGGEGRWKDRGDFARKFRKKKDGDWRRTRGRNSERSRKALQSIARFVRYTNPESQRIEVGLSSKRRPRILGKRFEKFAEETQRTRFVIVDEAVQNKLAATKNALPETKRKSAVPGKDFIIAEKGDVIVNPKRDIFNSVNEKYGKQAERVYLNAFADRFNFEARKRGFPFTPLR